MLHAAENQPGRSVTDLLSLIRHAFEAIPESDDTRLETARQTMKATRAMLLRDLESVEGMVVRDTAELRIWIQAMIAKYEAWMKRLAA